jgi:hypothetical protein
VRGAAISLVALAACGRIGFDARGDGGNRDCADADSHDAQRDGAAVVPSVIATSSNTMSGTTSVANYVV